MLQISLSPLFFSSIPKCGKNLIYSFFFALGYQRYQFRSEVYNHYSNLLPFSDIPKSDHYVTERGQYEFANHHQAVNDLKSEINSISQGYIGHRHMHPDAFLTSALRNTLIRPIFIYRDPRDCLVSAMHYAFSGKPSHISRYLRNLSHEDALILLLEGGGLIVPFARWFDAYRNWLDIPEISILRFEDIIGSRGGGCDIKQRECLEKLVNELGIKIPNSLFNSALERVFNTRAGTFRKGQIGSWKNSFSTKVNNTFNKEAGHLLKLWGYNE